MSDPQSSPSQREVQELTDLARRFSESGRHEEAADLLMVALRLDPKSLSVKLGLAEVRKRQQQHSGGSSRSLRDLLREGFRRNAIDASHFLGLAHLYAEKGENARAVECIEVAKANDLANPANHKLHARLLFRRRDFDGAAEEFTRALRYNPFDRETAENLGRAEFERKQFEPALGATVQAFLLLNDGDEEGVRRLRRRIQTLKQILGWGNRELSRLFRERQEVVHTAFDRLEWHRERFLEQAGMPGANLSISAPPPPRRETGGQIELAARLRRLKPLAHFSDELIFRLTQAVREEEHDIGNLVYSHRSSGRELYVLERGEINLQRTTTYGTFTLGFVEGGELFGEGGFLTG
ncbi:MAG TPA: tetratricopeptide repeat protein, partial [Thermoanaerobaculia bacterium]|nr:tetratricopeptide repeat protein [Thermoanaerobaculia bacterium]